MNQLLYLIAPRWLGGLLVGVALVLGVCLLILHRKRNTWSQPLLLWSSALALAGIGGIAVPAPVGMWLTIAAAALLFGKTLWLILTGQWWTPLAILACVLAVVGVGGWAGIPLGEALAAGGKALWPPEFVQPAWLWLLTLIPVIILLSYRSLAGLGTFRRWTAITLRCLLVLALTLALAEVRIRQGDDIVTTLFLLDRSLSVPEETDEDAPKDAVTGRKPDRRWERLKRFINDSVELRGTGHKRDRAGLIVFGRRPRLELPPSDAPRFNFRDVASNLDTNYTDIGGAIKLALASFPEGTGRRIVLISDGNENIGNAEEQAQLARRNGVQIDVVPLARGQRNQSEVLLQSVEVPPNIEQGSRYPIYVVIRSYNPRPVRGILELEQTGNGRREHVGASPMELVLRPGVNRVPFPPPKDRPKGSYTYQAKFIPKLVLKEDGTVVQAPLGRIQNKEASTHVLALGQRRVLFVEAIENEHQFLVEHLKGLGESKFKVDAVTASKLPKDKDALAVLLSNYDCLILANVPSEMLDEEQQEIVRSNTHDQGCGLIMIGGPESFGAGGWQGTAIEKALPVDCDIKALKVQGKGGLVLVMHACEMADGNAAQKKIAHLAINKLGPMDMIGVVGLGNLGQEWHVKFETVGEKREQMKRQVDKMTPGDMPDFDSPLQMAYDKLSDPKHELAKKHVIVISDGDPQMTNRALLNKMKAEKITVTTVGVATHGMPEDQQMLSIATATGGRYHNIKNPKLLPEVYTKEVRLVSQSFVYEKRFQPKLVMNEGPTNGMPENLIPLYGFVRTTPKPAITVQMPILGPPQGDQDFPVLALWHYGLGKSVAFTSDARSGFDRRTWDREWADSQMYKRFWEQVVDWSLRAVESGKMTQHSEHKDGKVRVTIDARDEKNQPITDLKLRGGVTSPSPRMEEPRKLDLKFEQTNGGQYVAEFKAEEAGSYFINVQPVRMVKKKVIENGKVVEKEVEEGFDSVRGGVTIPYSPEFADMESNVALLEKVRDITGGTTFEDEDAVLAQAARSGAMFRPGLPASRSMQPIWYWLVLLAGVFLFFDVAVRRIAVEPMEVWDKGHRVWQKLRGQLVAASATPQFLDRLKSKKAEIGELLEKGKAQSRFDAPTTGPVVAPPPGADASALPPVSRPAPRPATPKPASSQGDAGDFASRLMKAKKRAMEDRDKNN